MRVSTRVKASKPIRLGPNAHQRMEAYIRRIFERERHEISRIVLSVESTAATDQRFITCRITLTLKSGGLVSISDFGDTIYTAVQQAGLRARQVVRRRLHKRHTLARRSGNRVEAWLAELAAG